MQRHFILPHLFPERKVLVMNHSETLKKYLQFLGAADYENLMLLFAKDAIVYSPLYGEVAAVQFYMDLFEDTLESKLTLINIFSGENGNTAAVQFHFDWILSNGTKASFEVIDICKFSSDGKIVELKIIYDSAKTRPVFEKLSS